MTNQTIKPGDIYEDCSYHPVLCTNTDDDEIEGISLIDGSSPRCCSLSHCNVTKLSLKEAIHIKEHGPTQEKKDHIKALELQGWSFTKWWSQ